MSLDAFSAAVSRLCTAYRSSYRIGSGGAAARLARRPGSGGPAAERAWAGLWAHLPAECDLEAPQEWEGALLCVSGAVRSGAIADTLLPALERASRAEGGGFGILGGGGIGTGIDELLAGTGAGPEPAAGEAGGGAVDSLDPRDCNMIMVLMLAYLYLFFNFSGDPIAGDAGSAGIGVGRGRASATRKLTTFSSLEVLMDFVRILGLFADHDHRFAGVVRGDSASRPASDGNRVYFDPRIGGALYRVMSRAALELDVPSDSIRPTPSLGEEEICGGEIPPAAFRLLCRDVAQLLFAQVGLATALEASRALLLHDTALEGQVVGWALASLKAFDPLPGRGPFLTEGPISESGAAADADVYKRLAAVYNSFSMLVVLIAQCEDYKYSLANRAGFVERLASFLCAQAGALVAGSSPGPGGPVGDTGGPPGPETRGLSTRALLATANVLSALADFYANLTLFDFPELSAGVRAFASRFDQRALRSLVRWYRGGPHLGGPGAQLLLRVLLYVALVSLSFAGVYPCDRETLGLLAALSLMDPDSVGAERAVPQRRPAPVGKRRSEGEEASGGGTVGDGEARGPPQPAARTAARGKARVPPRCAPRAGGGEKRGNGSTANPGSASPKSASAPSPGAVSRPPDDEAIEPEDQDTTRYISVTASVILALQVYHSGAWGDLPRIFAEGVSGAGSGLKGVSVRGRGSPSPISTKTGSGAESPAPASSAASTASAASTVPVEIPSAPLPPAPRPAEVLHHLATDLCKFATLQVLLSFVCAENRKRLMAVFQRLRELALEAARGEAGGEGGA